MGLPPEPDSEERGGVEPDPAPDEGVVRASVDRIRRGGPNAFAQIVTRYQHRLFGLVLMMVRDPAAAEDVTQETFVRAFTRLDRYDKSRPFYPWLATIAVRLAQSALRRRSRIVGREGTPLDAASEPLDRGADALSALIEDEKARRLWRQVSGLPSGQRTAVFLYYKQGMKVADIARTLGVTSGTVKTLLFRARRTLGRSQGPVSGEPMRGLRPREDEA